MFFKATLLLQGHIPELLTHKKRHSNGGVSFKAAKQL